MITHARNNNPNFPPNKMKKYTAPKKYVLATKKIHIQYKTTQSGYTINFGPVILQSQIYLFFKFIDKFRIVGLQALYT
jgi:hypothetical protein